MTDIVSDEFGAHARAIQLLQKGNPDAARELLEQLVAAGTVNADIFNDLGTVCFSQGDLERSILMLKVAADLDFSGTRPLRNIVSVYLSAGYIGEAFAALSMIAKRDGVDDGVLQVVSALLTEVNAQLNDLAWLSPTIAALQEQLTSLKRENDSLLKRSAELQNRLLAIEAGEHNRENDEVRRYCLAEASAYVVLPDVHPDDFIFRFFLDHPTFAGVPGVAVHRYFDSGAMSTEKLRNALFDDLDFPRGQSIRLLEFASGYGCVTRHLVRHPNDLDVVACDIHGEAMKFIADSIHAKCLLSAPVPENFAASEQFDAVFALSFFSHMPERTWGRWLAALFRVVKPGGCLLFTTHGHASAGPLGNPTLSDDGFWFKPISEQHDLEGSEYGSTITAPKYVRRQIEQLGNAALEISREAYWWGHQDFWAMRKLRC